MFFSTLLFSFFSSEVEERVAKRIDSLSTVLYYIPKEGVVFYYMLNNPKVAIFGAGAGGIDAHIYLNINQLNMNDSIIKSGIVKSFIDGNFLSSVTPSGFLPRWFADFGMVGVLLLWLVLYRMIQDVRGTQEYYRLRVFMFMILAASPVMSSIAVFMLFYVFSFAHASAVAKLINSN